MTKNKGARQGGAFQRLTNWALGTKPPTEQQGLVATSGNQISEWPAEYDHTALENATVVGGKICYTVGEHKAATAKFYRNKL